MGFTITGETQDTVTIGERLWLTADRQRVVKDLDPDAAFLFCAAGNTVLREEADRYGLIGEDAANAETSEPELAARKMDEIQAIADELGVDHTGVRKKADLVALIEAAREDAANAETSEEA